MLQLERIEVIEKRLWCRRLVVRKFDGSRSCRYPGRPRIDGEIERLVVRMAVAICRKNHHTLANPIGQALLVKTSCICERNTRLLCRQTHQAKNE